MSADEQEQKDVCPFCGGDGWYIGHEDACYEDGDCHCSGVQIECECKTEPARLPSRGPR